MNKEEGKQQERFLKRNSVKAQHRPSIKSRVDTIIDVLASEPKERSQQQIEMLGVFMKSITFFAELVATVDQEALVQCCQYMTLEYFSEGDFIFHADDEAHNFYVIISGSVAILKPEGRVDGKRTYQQLALLREGGSFGELALISHTQRAASVLCRENTCLGVLGRTDYLRILGKVQGLLLSKKVDLLHRNPVFSRWTKYSLQKFSYFFKDKSYSRKQTVFRSEEPANEVFVVKSGEFQLVTHIDLMVRRTIASLKEVEKTRCQAEVTIVSTGELLGAYEAVRDLPYRYTCVCYSTTGEVLSISKDDFVKRMSGEEAVTSLITLSEVIEGQRDVRIQTISQREMEKRDVNRLMYAQFLRKAVPSGLTSPILSAKKDLEAEVRDRWFLSKGEFRGKPDSKEWAWMRSYPTSPRVGSPVERTERPRHGRSWSDIMKMKFAKRSGRNTEMRMERHVVNIHTQKLKRTLSPRYLHLQQALCLPDPLPSPSSKTAT